MRDTALPQQAGRRPLELKRSFARWHTFSSYVLSVFTGLATVAACIPLVSVLFMLLWRGATQLRPSMFWNTTPAALQAGGGFGNALVGTVVVVAIAALISVPFGILAAIFLAEFGPESRLAGGVRFCAKLLTGFPSILAGVFAYAVVVLTTGTFSAPAGGVALSILMLPIVMLTAEEALKMVPHKMKEAAVGMGATRTQVVWKVIVPTALPGMFTGVMLAVARAAGETAPLLFTLTFSDDWIVQDGELILMEPAASLAVMIYNFSGSPHPNLETMAWIGAFVLVMLVLTFNLTGQYISYRTQKH